MRSAAVLAFTMLAVPVAQAADGDSIESLVKAVYDTISGPNQDWARFRALFAEGARMIPMRVTPQGPAPALMTPEEYEKRVGGGKNVFYESPIAQRVETFGNIAHVFSTYELRRVPGDKPFARGINSFQLVRQGGTWKVMTILWDSEREGTTLPEKYLK